MNTSIILFIISILIFIAGWIVYFRIYHSKDYSEIRHQYDDRVLMFIPLCIWTLAIIFEASSYVCHYKETENYIEDNNVAVYLDEVKTNIDKIV